MNNKSQNNLLKIRAIPITLTVLVLFILNNTVIFAQIQYTKSFTDKLNKANLLFYKPADTWFHLIPMEEDDFFEYDLVIESDDGDIEMRYMIHPWKERDEDEIPHILAMNVAMEAASNDEKHLLKISPIDNVELKNTYNADWGMIVNFKPKSSLSNKQYGRLLALFSENKGNVHVIYLFDPPAEGSYKFMQAVEFKE